MEKFEKRKRGRPEKLEPLKDVVARLWAANEKWNDEDIRNGLRLFLMDQVRKEHRGWPDSEINYEVDQRLPSVYLIGDYRRDTLEMNITLPDKEDFPWSLGKTPELPADAIAMIFIVQKFVEGWHMTPKLVEFEEWTKLATGGRLSTNIWLLSVRDARWIARLFKIEELELNKDDFDLFGHPLPEPMYNLWFIAKTYSDYERLCKIAAVEPDTSLLDDGIRHDTFGEAKHALFIQYNPELTEDGGK